MHISPPRPASRLTAALEQGPVILDGAMGTELEARGVDTSHELWSALALIEQPQAVSAVHADYLRAGAQVITTDSYQASLPAFMRAGLSEARARAALAASARLALEAREAHAAAGGGRALVAGSVGPYGAYLADGSEYTGDYRLDPAGWAAFHTPRLEILLEEGVEALAVETMPRLDEAQAIMALIIRIAGGPDAAPPVWVSFQVRPDGLRLADGTPLGRAGAWADEHEGLVAIGVNCVTPGAVLPALGALASVTSKPLVACPNSGEAYHPGARTWTASRGRQRPTDLAPRWIRAGARLVGGCCRTTPADTAALVEALALVQPPR
ncbi:homocysteine S-methyltransferase [Actinomyces bowdenii]|uniref:Homocysteine S-methyltransferase n=1 Tax=Actinomyces bowdenii TaxID=131109 RepID=A0A3P1V880_9ACTO|nr:homocysteine S-methyltransferase [Actinomyces bowdenii]RRD29710.1 homocysteine S-methyltransferase [Actinomyces bowdenii]